MFFQTKKALSDVTNIKKIQKYLDNNRLYPSWDIFGAATGRIITRQPQIRSVLPEILFFVICSKQRPEYTFIVGDYSMIEIVIIAVISQDETLLDILNKNMDLHIYLASQVLQTPYEQLMDLKTTDPHKL